ncbi:hypothetical protein SSX86_010638 [Deinandra increscens subsp. villosa]|uniref:Uncharacterized protein n=1 Tax=Deinandra increscens subsp. villosa TaxID=3103831 RepID=A0AAP0DFM7_9ASTR
MSGETPSIGAFKPRSALGDVTNQVGKRGFSLISGDDCKKDEGIPFAKKECRKIDISHKENNVKETVDCVLRPHSYSEISSLNGDVKDSVSKIVCEIKGSCPPGVRQNVTPTSSSIAGDLVSDSFQPVELVHVIPSDENGNNVVVDDEEDERTDSEVMPEIALKGTGENNLGMDDGNDVSVDNLDSSKDEFLDGSRLLESQESKCGFERCNEQKGDGLSSVCMDMIKACSCSFCMKAAYLWSDLHYQDVKGRITAIKKSQKEAAILVNRNSRDVASNFEKFSNLESDLTGRWKSLFLHMEDIFVREGTQLVSRRHLLLASIFVLKILVGSCSYDEFETSFDLERSLSTLKELLDDCKTDSAKN